MTPNRVREPRIIHTRSPDGAEIVRAELTNRPGVFATLDLADWNAQVAQRATRLFLNGNGQGHFYVRSKRRDVAGGTVSVARELLAPGRGRVVTYADGDRLNLRRSNLRVERDHGGSARGQTFLFDATPPLAMAA